MSILNLKNHLPAQLSRIAGVALVACCVWQLAASFVAAPLSEKLARKQSLQHRLNELKNESSEVDFANTQLACGASQCIDSTPASVTHRYQQWLLKRTESVRTVAITPSQPSPEGELGWRVGFQLQGEAPIQWVASLLEDLAQAPLLHRISYLDLQPVRHGSSNNLQFTCTLDVLVMDGANSQASWPESIADLKRVRLDKFLTQLDPFTRGYHGPPPKLVATHKPSQKKTKPAPPKIDFLKSLRLVGSVVINGSPQAWIVDSRTQQEFLVPGGGKFTIQSSRATINTIHSDWVDLVLGGQHIRWPLGDTLRSVVAN